MSVSPSSAPQVYTGFGSCGVAGVYSTRSQQRHSSIHSFVSSRVDYCNALLTGAPKVTTDKLQRVMNAAARVIIGTHKFDRGLQALHHGAQLPARTSAAVLGRPLPISLRRRFSAASQVHQSTTPGSSASPVANVRLTGFLCC